MKNLNTEKEFNAKWNIHKIVQEAVSSAHLEPSPQTLSEINNLKIELSDNKVAHSKIMDKIDEFGEKLEELKIQIAELPDKIFERADIKYVNKDRFMTVERAVFALIGALCLGVVYILINHLLK